MRQKHCIVCHKVTKGEPWIEAWGIRMHFDCMKKLRDARETCHVGDVKCYTDSGSDPGRKCGVAMESPPSREPSPGGSHLFH